jgi:O-antigen ligase
LAAALLVLMVAYAPGMYLPSVSVRSVVIWTLAVPGLVVLGLLAVRGDRAARWAAAFLAWALVAVLVSHHPARSMFAAYGADRGWVFLAACLACWALGRRGTDAGSGLLVVTIFVGLAANAVVALVQARTDGVELFALTDGRTAGLTDNPIFFGALMGGGMALGAALAARASPHWWRWLGAVVGCSAAVNLSGSRIALVMGTVTAVAAAIVPANRSVVRVAAVLGAVTIGVVLSAAVVDVSATARSEGGQVGDGMTSRTLMWRAGIDAAADRPFTGWGPGRFQEATEPRATAEYVRAEGPDRPFADAHNELVELLVTTGVPGTVLALGFGWAVATGRSRARGPLAWFAMAIVGTWVLQPTSASTAPIALLALGFASTAEPQDLWPRSSGRRGILVATAALGALGGLFVGVRLLATDRDVRTGVDEVSAPAIERAAARFPSDPYLADVQAWVLFRDALVTGGPERAAAALDAARHSVDVDDTKAVAWVRLAMAQQALGPGDEAADRARARRSLHRALEESPWSVFAMTELRQLELAAGRDAVAGYWEDRLCAVDACPPTA